ncbi:hypothetical protein SD1617_5948 [Shigella dysenteriae 1617]|nr:hypothetical protein SD1617_5948 [Shigella dysenteriae 1617]
MALICELDEQWSFVAVKPGNTGSGTRITPKQGGAGLHFWSPYR